MPVLVLLGLLLCGSHWQKVLIGKDPANKACNTAGSRNGVDISRGLVSKCRAISGSRIRFTVIGNVAHIERATKGHK